MFLHLDANIGLETRIFEGLRKGFKRLCKFHFIGASKFCLLLDLLKEILNLILLFQTKESIYHNSDATFLKLFSCPNAIFVSLKRSLTRLMLITVHYLIRPEGLGNISARFDVKTQQSVSMAFELVTFQFRELCYIPQCCFP